MQRLSQRSIEFDLVGVDASIANALRRILISEVGVPFVELIQRMLKLDTTKDPDRGDRKCVRVGQHVDRCRRGLCAAAGPGPPQRQPFTGLLSKWFLRAG